GKVIDSNGWCPATSGNFSARLDDGTIAITVSGKHKGQLQRSDIMLIDALGHSLDGKIPSAETLLHVQLYQRFSDVHAILHPHSLNSTVISTKHKKRVLLKNYELLKAFSGISTHESRINIPIFANTQNISQLAQQVDEYMDLHDDIYAYLIAGHGLYTWGASVTETLRYLEALDFLFACELQA
ncbi:MAG: methylthioribulose 1-phosphate dehydratase, partial [Methylococcales bacterium]|nr:methylthioribulose 1-phosphate dehydratase [Methylococcales bacterium]